jgi:hypothetical protein
VIVGCLEHFFEARQKPEALLELAESKLLAYREERGAARVLHFTGADGFREEGLLVVQAHRGNVYDVSPQMSGHEKTTLNVTIPDLKAPVDESRTHTERVCRRLFAEL